jgi:hypothetical protein
MTSSWRTQRAIGAAVLVAMWPLWRLVAGGGSGPTAGELVLTLAVAVLSGCYLAVTVSNLPAPSRSWFYLTLVSKSVSVAAVTELVVYGAQVGPFAVFGAVLLIPVAAAALGTLLLRRGHLWGMLPSLLAALTFAAMGSMFDGGAFGRVLDGGPGWEFLLGAVLLVTTAVRAARQERRTATVGGAPVDGASPSPQSPPRIDWQAHRTNDRQYGWAVAAIVFTLVPGLLGAWFCVSVYEEYNPAPPDVKGFAASSAVVQADAGAEASINASLSQLRAAVPSIDNAGTMVDDYCGTDDSIDEFGQRPVYKPITCQRIVVRVGAFDGDPATESTLIARALTREGWDLNGGSGGVLLNVSRSDNGLTLTTGVSAKPALPTLFLPEVPNGAGGAPSAAPGPLPAGVAFRDLQVPSLTALAATAYKSHDYVITIEITSDYFTQPAPTPTPTPVPSYVAPYGGDPCYSGSGTCN